MSKLTANDLILVLRDLTGKRHIYLVSSHIGRAYEPQFRARLVELEASPEVLKGTPLADQLTAADADHDEHGRALYYLTEAYLHSPLVSDEVRAAAGRVQADFVPALGVLTASYPDESARVKNLEHALVERHDDLLLLSIAGGSALDWAMAFVAAARRIGLLLSSRGDARPTSGAGRTWGALRGATIGLLNRFRAALQDEIHSDPKLDPALDQKVFGYYDELLHARKQHPKAAAGGEPADSDKPEGA